MKRAGLGNISVVLIIVGIVIIAVIVILLIVTFGVSMTGNAINIPSKNCRDVQVPYQETEEYSETIPYTDTECETKEIAYSINNFIFNYETCNQYQDRCDKYILGICSKKTTFCVDKSVSCSLTLRNLDNEERGQWTIRFLFKASSSVVDTQDVTNFLYPQSEKQFVGVSRITSEGEEGDANKAITCSYVEADAPTKQVCKDVTRYKDVIKTRIVTKYKTENQCE